MYKKSIPESSTNVMKSVGQILRERREKQGFSAREVADAIKVREKYVLAIESGDYGVFASPVYLKGFLKNYAKFLEMDPEHVVAIYRRDSEERKVVGLPEDAKAKSIRTTSFVLSPQIVLTVLGILFVVGVLGYLVSQFYQAQKPPELEITAPKDGATVTETPVTVKGVTAPEAILTVNGKEVKVAEDGKFNATVALDEGSNTIVVKSKDSTGLGKEATQRVEIFYEIAPAEGETPETPGTTPPAGTPETPKPTTNKSEMSLVIEVGPENAWIELSIDGAKEYAKIASTGEKIEFVAKESIEILTGKMNSTKVIVNDKEQSFEGQSGVGRLECKLDESLEDGFVCALPE